MNSSQSRELDRIDAEPMEFEWKNFPGFITLQILAEIQNMIWREGGNEYLCIANSKILEEYAKRFPLGHWFTELLLIGCLTELIRTQRSKSNMLTPKKTTHILTERNFTRDEWDHLLHLMNIMIFSMFSRSHVLSNRKQSIMSKRTQERTAQEGSAVAKPKPNQ